MAVARERHNLESQLFWRRFVSVETFVDGADIIIGEASDRGHDVETNSQSPESERGAEFVGRKLFRSRETTTRKSCVHNRSWKVEIESFVL